jgi:hypothetical protein
MELYLHSFIRLHGMVLNLAQTELYLYLYLSSVTEQIRNKITHRGGLESNFGQGTGYPEFLSGYP